MRLMAKKPIIAQNAIIGTKQFSTVTPHIFISISWLQSPHGKIWSHKDIVCSVNTLAHHT